MESAAAAQQVPRRRRAAALLHRIDLDLVAKVGFFALLAVAVVGFFVYPTYPNYDSYYSLLWGRELLAFQQLSFEAYRAPTEHPLAIVFSAVLIPFGESADRIMIFITLLSMVAVVAGVYRLSRVAFTPLVGLAAAFLMATRFDFPFLAVRGYIDVPYIALVLWAAVLEYERPRRGWPVFVLLALAGMMRPEAWPLAALYFVWMSFGPEAKRLVGRWWNRGEATTGPSTEAGSEPGREPLWQPRWGEWATWAALAAIGPVVWAATDFAVTGNPLYSLTSTQDLAGELGRQRSLADVPAALPTFFGRLVKLPVVIAAIIGLGLGAWFVPRRIVMPALLLLTGIGTFAAVGLAGLSVIDRYLIVAAVALVIFGGLAIGGFTLLAPGTRARRVWASGSGIAVVFALVFTVTHPPSLTGFNDELRWRSESHDSLVALLASPEVQDRVDAGCGPVSTPSHKIIPDVRWLLDLDQDEVVARSDPSARAPATPPSVGPGREREGIALYVQGGRRTVQRQGFASNTEPLTQVPPPGFARIKTTEYYSAYANCAGG
ncbi:MAG: hypothetical protein ACR2NA_05985 [Solirubrobacterales bacterium]